eukprot:TRINITY_DN8828_c0_g1_i8.p1 TRINITY_DN8828_c0_g1~~TRINITY_DN8828_c0_g1_i8.p1  ORF type:complete len:528 (+),score=126.86 TRINITY_DN8828_c0_g1_i8:53-1585(+)
MDADDREQYDQKEDAEDEFRLAEFTQICVRFLGNPTASVPHFLHQVPLPTLFMLLVHPESDKDIFRKAAEKVLISPVGLQALQSQEVLNYLSIGLNYEDDEIRMITTKLLQTVVTQQPNAITPLVESMLWEQLLHQLEDSATSIAEKSSAILVEMVRSNEAALTRLLADDTQARLAQMVGQSAYNSTMAIRALDLLVRASHTSEAALAALTATPTFQQLFQLVLNDDPLLQMSLLQLIAQFGNEASGLAYLVHRQPVTLLQPLFDTPFSFLLAAALQCLASLLTAARKHGRSAWIESAGFPRLVAHLSLSPDPTTQEAVMLLLAELCATESGLVLFLQPNGQPLPALPWMASRVMSPHDTLRLAALHALASIFTPTYECGGVCATALQQIYTTVDPHNSLLTILFNFVKQPFEEQRNSSFRVMAVLAKQTWLIPDFVSTPALVEWLTNRSTESSHVGNDWKFTIIQNLVYNSSFGDFPDVLQKRLRQYYQQGRYYSPAHTQVLVRDDASR